MKRYNHLFEKIVDIDNLRLAEEKARKNKSKRRSVLKFLQNRDELLYTLQLLLVNGEYRTSKYTTFMIREPKERQIFRLPYYPDRIVHHAIMNILEPIWVSIMTTDTYSCIKNRGIHLAAKRIKNSLKDVNGTKYCLKLDVRKFYPSIDHDVLKLIIRKKIKDSKLLKLLDDIIDSQKGVPIGNYLSQFFANLYLAYFDHWIKECKKVKYYFRYADDIVIMSNNKLQLKLLLLDIGYYMLNIRLKIKDNYLIFELDSRGLSFVGYVFYHTHTKLRKSIKVNMCKKAARLNKIKSVRFKYYRRQLCSHIGWCKFCNAINLLNKIIKYRKLLDIIKVDNKKLTQYGYTRYNNVSNRNSQVIADKFSMTFLFIIK